jgi:hypothetical protein
MCKDIIDEVYRELKTRKIHPSGKFDKGERWYADNGSLIDVRQPSRSYPWSQMQACRTRKYVKAVCDHYDCKTIEELRGCV